MSTAQPWSQQEDGLILHGSVEAVVAQYALHEQTILNAMEAIARAEAAMRELFGKDSHIGVDCRNLDFQRPEPSMEQLRRQVWQRIVNLAGIRRLMSVKAAAELDQLLWHGKLPDITAENVRNMINTAKAQAPDHITDAILEVHQFLTPQSARFKSNQRTDVGERVCLAHWVSNGWSTARPFQVNHYRSAEVRALDNVFRLMDGKPPYATHSGELADAINQCPGSGETPYFSFRCYKNGSLHLRFKRLDLLAKLNATAGGNRLYPPTAG